MENLNSIRDDIIANGHIVFSAVMSYLPKMIVALVLGLIGYFIAVTLDKWVVKLAKKLKVDSLLAKTNLDEQLDEAGVKMRVSKLLGTAVRWVVLVITLLMVADMFDLDNIQSFITLILGIIGNIIVALFIFAIAVYAARFAGALGSAVAKYVEFRNTKLISDIIKVVIYFAAFIQILGVLGATQVTLLIMGLLQAIFYGAALAIGIAFGLGGQDKAKDFVEKLRR